MLHFHNTTGEGKESEVNYKVQVNCHNYFNFQKFMISDAQEMPFQDTLIQ